MVAVSNNVDAKVVYSDAEAGDNAQRYMRGSVVTQEVSKSMSDESASDIPGTEEDKIGRIEDVPRDLAVEEKEEQVEGNVGDQGVREKDIIREGEKKSEKDEGRNEGVEVDRDGGDASKEGEGRKQSSNGDREQ